MIEDLYSLFRQNPHISTDSRAIESGSIFFALRGESFDGNRYAITALERGAVACVVDDPSLLSDTEHRQHLILVDCVLETLQQLAQLHRQRLGIEILAITGSNGKTTTKELVAATLGRRYKLYATKGNLNNHIGVPLTLLSMDESTEFGIVEMGASSCGEIALLCSIAQPNYGIVTNIGRAHLDGFGGEQGVRRGKGELMDYLQRSGGVLFVPAENEVLLGMAREREGLKCSEYHYDLSDGVRPNLEGEYNRYNVAAAVAIARYFELAMQSAQQAIASYTPTNNRSQRNETQHNTLIIDCYNANPSSMDAALQNFTRESFPNRLGKVLILGDMRELGEWSTAEHERVIASAINSGAKRVILVGDEFRLAASKCGVKSEQIELYKSCAELKEELQQRPITDSALLIKGSRGVGLEQIITLL